MHRYDDSSIIDSRLLQQTVEALGQYKSAVHFGSECGCRQGKETARHFLLVGTNHERETDKLRKNVGIRGMRVEKLRLCFSGSKANPLTPNPGHPNRTLTTHPQRHVPRKGLGDVRRIKDAVRFIEETGRLEF